MLGVGKGALASPAPPPIIHFRASKKFKFSGGSTPPPPTPLRCLPIRVRIPHSQPCFAVPERTQIFSSEFNILA